MNRELEAAANKQAFPWQCRLCTETFHYNPRRETSFGPVCADCWQQVKERAYNEG